jgi:hypothetical protein
VNDAGAHAHAGYEHVELVHHHHVELPGAFELGAFAVMMFAFGCVVGFIVARRA